MHRTASPMHSLRFSGAIMTCCLAVGSATASPPTPLVPAASPAPSSSAVTDSAPSEDPAGVECKLYCEAPRMIPRVAPEPDYTQREIDNANGVLASMSDDLLGCYKKRLRVSPGAHAAITVDILVGSDGHVRNVDTTGGAVLGAVTMACIVHRIDKGVFEPPHGGGTIHVQVPFTLRVAADDEQT